MFLFQLGSLHISKDALYDSNNLVLNSVYQIPMTSSQGRQWVVDCGCYHIVGDSLTHNSQETILTPKIIGSVVKIVKQHKVKDIRTLFPIKPSSSNFIKLYDFSSGDDLTPHSLSTISLNLIS
jgi:hypothetical protein